MLVPNNPRTVLKVPLTPLIDIVFILLLFFMLSSTFIRNQHIEFSASSAKGKTAVSESTRLILRLDGSITVNGVVLSPDSAEFSRKLSVWRDDSTKLIVTPESRVEVQAVVMLLDRLRSSGITLLNLSESLQR